MANNLPPGVTSKDIDDHFGDDGKLREQAEENIEALYRLILETRDGQVLYEDTFHSQESLQESGLRKADVALEEAVQSEMKQIVWENGEV